MADFESYTLAVVSHTVITDLTIHVFTPKEILQNAHPNQPAWRRIDKELYLHQSKQNAWLYAQSRREEELANECLFVIGITVGNSPPNPSLGLQWEERPGGLWLLRSKLPGMIDRAVTEVDVLFGTDAVDPRPGWNLLQSPLQLNGQPEIPAARLSVFRGRAEPEPPYKAPLRAGQDGRFKVVQISDTHMVTGPGICKDALGARGESLPDSEADPLTVDFIGRVLDAEKPDLVVLTGDQLHHDILDSQSAIFKVTAPIIERSIPFAAVFGNHDSEGEHALSRKEQMFILQRLPLSYCEPGPELVDGVGNFYLEVLGPAPSRVPFLTLYFLDSHDQTTSTKRNPDYDYIKQTQIDWFAQTSKARRTARGNGDGLESCHMSLVFQHIPLPEFSDHRLCILDGDRREPTEGPSFNSRFYDTLMNEGVSAIGCGHDHVNDFCALLPPRPRQEDDDIPLWCGPWLCYGGTSGFGGYCSYNGERLYRRARVWEFDTTTESLNTWKQVEYDTARVDELLLVECGAVVGPQ